MELSHPVLPSLGDSPAKASRQSVFREVRWRWRDVLIGFAPMAVMTVASLLIDPTRLPVGPHWLWLPFMAIGLAWTLGYPLWVLRRYSAIPRPPRPRTFMVEALYALLATVITMVILGLTFSVLISLFGEQARTTMPLKPIAESPHRYDWIGLLFLAIVGAPACEEVFFRGMFYSALRQRLPVIVAAPIQAVVFGVSHRFGPSDTAGIVLIGVGLALLYEWRRTLLAPMLMHAMVNAFAMVVMAQSIAADAAAPRLGIYPESPEGACVISNVAPGSAAETSGLRVGDVITQFDGQRIPTFESLRQAVRTKQVGQAVVVEFMRNGKTQRVDVVLTRLRE